MPSINITIQNAGFLYKLEVFFLAIFISMISTVSYAQLTAHFLENAYHQKLSTALEQKFKTIAMQTDSIRFRNANDTMILISKLIDAILTNDIPGTDTNYFFLQKDVPEITIENVSYKLTPPFCPEIINHKLIPLVYSANNIYEINSFIGSNPYESFTNVKKYIKSKGLIRKLGFWNAKKKIKHYQDRTKFISQFLYLPSTWNKLDKSLTLFNVAYINLYNQSMNTAEISYSFSSFGAIEIYDYKNGKWTLSQTKMSWID